MLHPRPRDLSRIRFYFIHRELRAFETVPGAKSAVYAGIRAIIREIKRNIELNHAPEMPDGQTARFLRHLFEIFIGGWGKERKKIGLVRVFPRERVRNIPVRYIAEKPREIKAVPFFYGIVYIHIPAHVFLRLYLI
jgi:hypothetical protein